ncbi:MAG: hypothetical protein HC802_16910 [Caldilineaceae bacterium]|nr:hypothetical protein [Caldilineaceae bacterium]
MRECRVNHLRLKADDTQHARQAARMVEDGLHTATLPADGGRLVLVRSLALGRISTAASSLSVSLLIEQALNRLPQQLVYGGHPSAATATSVYFHDEVDAWLQLGQQVAAGRLPSAWFWPRVAPGYRPDLPRPTVMLLLLRAALSSHSGPVHLVQLVRGLADANALDPLLDALSPDHGQILLGRCGWKTVPDPLESLPQRPPRVRSRFTPILVDWLRRWGDRDTRSQWLANILLAVEQPTRLDESDLSRAGRGWIAQVMESPAEAAQRLPDSTTGSGRPARTARLDSTGDTSPAPRRIGERTEAEPHQDQTTPAGRDVEQATPTVQKPRLNSPEETSDSSILATSEQPQETPAQKQAEQAEIVETLPAEDWRGDLLRTQAGGLYFLAAALRQLGFENWLREHPAWADAQLSGRLLTAICGRLAVADDDPIWLTLEVDGESDVEIDDIKLPALEPLAGWRKLRIEIAPIHKKAEWRVQDGVGLWLTALERWCALYTRLDLAEIVLRPAWLHHTQTHIDLHFSMAQVDLSIRRAGLDIDPGWVGWLGRVVLFHYGEV